MEIMAKTRSTLRTNIRMYLDEVSAADWSDSQINVEINYAYLRVYKAVVDVWEDHYRTRVKTSMVASQNEYALPSDFYKLKRLEATYVSGQDRVKVRRFDFSQLPVAIDETSNYGSTASPIMELSGGFLRILPVPINSVTDAFLLHYIKQVAELDDDDDEIDIPFPDSYGKLVEIGAVAELLSKGQQEEEVSSKFVAKFEQGIEQMREELKDRIADGSPVILDVLGEDNAFDYTSTVPIITTS